MSALRRLLSRRDLAHSVEPTLAWARAATGAAAGAARRGAHALAEPAAADAPKRRGRPPGSTKAAKAAKEAKEGVASAPSLAASSAPRTPPTRAPAAAGEAAAAPKRRGRPPKVKAEEGGEAAAAGRVAPVDAPLAGAPSTSELAAAAAPKRRGRPPGSTKATGEAAPAAAAVQPPLPPPPPPKAAAATAPAPTSEPPSPQPAIRHRPFKPRTQYSAAPVVGGEAGGASIFYKTRLCRDWEAAGACPAGARCGYAHGERELRPSVDVGGGLGRTQGGSAPLRGSAARPPQRAWRADWSSLDGAVNAAVAGNAPPQQRPPWRPRDAGDGSARARWAPRDGDRAPSRHRDAQGQADQYGRAQEGGYQDRNAGRWQPRDAPAPPPAERVWRQPDATPWRGAAARRAPREAPAPAPEAKAKAKAKAKAAPAPAPAPRDVAVPAGTTLRQLARLLAVDLTALEDTLASLDARPASAEDAVDADAAELAALELGVAARVARPPPADAAPRPPIVAVMGHVDHGKTTLLDTLRNTSVAAGEAGGITQAVGAFEVRMPGSAATITFLDTPGHAAFTAMRARGAAGADVAVLVVDARDGVKPQTREAIKHAAAAGAPIVVAITKCDLPDADPARVRGQLLAEGVELEAAGGAVQCVEVSARSGAGLADLEDALLLQAATMNLAASPTAPAAGVVVEARVDRGVGPVATVVVSEGTLAPGAPIVVGCEWGRVRSLTAPGGGGAVSSAGPGTPVEVAGLRGVPSAGDALTVAPSEDRARRLAAARTARAASTRHGASAAAVSAAAEVAAAAAAAAGGDADGAAAAATTPTRVVLLVKGDTHGAAEAASSALAALSSPTVPVAVAASGVGPVSLSDVQHAAAIGATIVAYGVRAGGAAIEREARRTGVGVLAHRVIYALVDSVAALAAGAAPATAVETVVGTATVVALFPVSKGGAVVAGVRVTDGALAKQATFRVRRGGVVVFEGAASSLRRHKLDVERVGAGSECGLLLDGFAGARAGDVVEAVAVEYVARVAADVLGDAAAASA
jgi:translation initiation factor IF-2